MRKVVLVTGAASTIGSSIAKELASKGRDLLLCGRNHESLAKVATACVSYDVKADTFPYDFSDCTGLSQALAAFLSENDMNVESFVHVAGMTEVLPIKSVRLNVTVEVMNVNFYSAQQIVSTLAKQKVNGGNLQSIVFISTIVSGGRKYQSVYSASKAALESFAGSMAIELAPAVRVNTVRPGSIQSPMADSAYGNAEIADRVSREQLLGPGSAEDIAHTVAFLVSKDARWITGQHISVDGGESLKG